MVLLVVQVVVLVEGVQQAHQQLKETLVVAQATAMMVAMMEIMPLLLAEEVLLRLVGMVLLYPEAVVLVENSLLSHPTVFLDSLLVVAEVVQEIVTLVVLVVLVAVRMVVVKWQVPA
jgi:hypothetical protein